MNLVTRSTVIQLASDDNLIVETTDVIINFSTCKASDYCLGISIFITLLLALSDDDISILAQILQKINVGHFYYFKIESESL